MRGEGAELELGRGKLHSPPPHGTHPFPSTKLPPFTRKSYILPTCRATQKLLAIPPPSRK